MAPSRGIIALSLPAAVRTISPYTVCNHCGRRLLSTAVPLLSGHNRWSKIRHDKGKNDAAKNRQRSIFAQELTTASKLFGPDPALNSRLADLITKAKREGFAKASIEAAIARGQGRSLSGASLESVTVEGILPNNVAVIVECETDNKLRTLSDVRLILRDHGGSVTPSSYLFQRNGRVVFEAKEGVGVEEVLNDALEAGASDIWSDEEGRVVLETQPDATKSVSEEVAGKLDLQIKTAEIVWEPNEETKVGVLDEKAAQDLHAFLDDLEDRESSLQAVAMNVAQGSLVDGAWKDLRGRIYK